MSGVGVAVSPNIRLGGGAAFSPADIADLELWLDAGQGVTTVGSSPVKASAWADRSGKGWTGTQGTDAARPLFNASDSNLNGQPSLTFDAGRTMLLDMTSGSTDWTWFAVGYNNSVTGVRALIDDNSGAAFRFRASGGTMYSAVAGSSIGVAMDVNPHIICIRHGAGVGLMQIDAVTSAGTLPAFAIGTSYIGGRFNGTALDSWEDEIAEIIVYKAALSDDDIASVMDYLGGKYGIAVV